MKLTIDEEWFKKRAALEGDIEIGVDRRVEPKPCKPGYYHCYDHVAVGTAFNVYRCRYCGDEDWL